MLERERLALAADQAALAAVLMFGAPAPARFDPSRLRLTVNLLRSKRRREALQAFAPIVARLSDRAVTSFDDYARRFPTPHRGGPAADGLRFLRDLSRRRDLERTTLAPILLLAATQTIDAAFRVRRRRFGFALGRAENRLLAAVCLFGRVCVRTLPWPY